MATLQHFISLSSLLLMLASSTIALEDQWHPAHATFYGDMKGGETMMGARGYGDLFKQGYRLETTALNTTLFNEGHTCGACFEIRCVDSPQWCIPNSDIIVTATNFCPPDYSKTTDIWCNPPQKHFDLSLPMFLKIAQYKAGIVPVHYRRVSCRPKGGVKFEVKGNSYCTIVLVYNVGGAGDVADVKIRGSGAGWIPMSRNWGQNWQTNKMLVGEGLSFQVTLSDDKSMEFNNVAPSDWQYGSVFDGKVNF